MIAIFSLVVLFFGFGLFFCIAKSRWPGWMGRPFLVPVGVVILDLGITPLMAQFMGYRTISVAGLAWPEEVPAAAALILLNAFAIAMGMVIAWHLWDRNQPPMKSYSVIQYSPNTSARAWKISFAMFLFGASCHAVVLHFLLSDNSLLKISAERALFSSEQTLLSPYYNYARLLSETMIIGAWGMLLFYGKTRIRKQLAIIANSLTILLHMLYGGRMAVIMTLLAIMILYNYGIKPMRPKQIALFVVLALIGLLPIQFMRLQAIGFKDAFLGIISDISITGSINEAAFALRAFPERVPFLSWGVLFGGLGHLFPTLGDHIPWAKNLWISIVDYMFAGQNPSGGIGGEHYAPAAEHYMQFGLKGVIFLGLAFGLLYGRLFVWQKQQPRNLFLLMFSTYIFMAFFVSIMDGKMAPWVGRMGFGVLLPVGFITAMTVGRRWSELALIGPLFLCALSFFLRRLVDSDIFDYTFAAALVPAYLISLKFINRANPSTVRIWRGAFGKVVESEATFANQPYK